MLVEKGTCLVCEIQFVCLPRSQAILVFVSSFESNSLGFESWLRITYSLWNLGGNSVNSQVLMYKMRGVNFYLIRLGQPKGPCA